MLPTYIDRTPPDSLTVKTDSGNPGAHGDLFSISSTKGSRLGMMFEVIGLLNSHS